VEHDVVFGSFLTPSAEQPERVLDLARLTEEVGLDLVSVQDHPYQARFLDTWTLLSVIAARTSRVTVTPNVDNLPLRPPTCSPTPCSATSRTRSASCSNLWPGWVSTRRPHRTP
jgi:hypothetical protein